MTAKRLKEIGDLLADCGVNRPRYLDDWANDSVRLQLACRDLLNELREAEAYQMTPGEWDRRWKAA